MARPASNRPSPSKTMKRHGVSLPWSGTREAIVNSVSISAAEGPGATSSIGFRERLVRSNSRASGIVYESSGAMSGWTGVAHALAYRSRCDKRGRWLEFAAISAEKCFLMRIAATSAGGARVGLAVGFWLSVFVAETHAQFFNISPLPRPPSEVPGQTPGPAQNIAPPNNNNNNRPTPVPRGQQLQSLPPAIASPPPAASAPPAIAPAGHASLTLSARFGRDLPVIPNGLHWRVYPGRIEQGALRPIKEDRGATPTISLPAGSYVIHVGFGLASATRAVQLRAGEAQRAIFDLSAGGLRIEGKVGDARIPNGQISFDRYRGSQFEPGDKRPIV